MESLFEVKMSAEAVLSMGNLALAHVGDGVFSLMCRSYLALRGDRTVKNLHRHSVELVKAPTQAIIAEHLLPVLTEEEADFYRRGKNTHSHAAPKSASPREYTMSTGLETLFGALYLLGRKERLNELFLLGMEAVDGV